MRVASNHGSAINMLDSPGGNSFSSDMIPGTDSNQGRGMRRQEFEGFLTSSFPVLKLFHESLLAHRDKCKLTISAAKIFPSAELEIEPAQNKKDPKPVSPRFEISGYYEDGEVSGSERP